MSSQDAEKNDVHEEGPPCEGRCDVYNVATGTILSAALCPPGKPVTNNSTERGRSVFGQDLAIHYYLHK